MDSVKHNSSSGGSKHYPSSTKHKVLQKSKTLNRKFVKQPKVKSRVLTREQMNKDAQARRAVIAEQMNRERNAAISRKAKVEPVKIVAKSTPVATKPEKAPTGHPTVAVAKARVAARKAEPPRQLTAQELKERAIAQALRRVAGADDSKAVIVEEQMTEVITKKRRVSRKKKLLIAFSMAAASIALLGYLVHLNLPDLSVRVAAMQSGIDGAYPSYVPKGYRLDGLVAEKNGKITMNFSHQDGGSFSLTEEKSAWDSATLLSQFVKPEWGKDFLVIKEQGLTIYVVDSNAAWMNAGVMYYIEDPAGDLTQQQLHDIAISF